MPLSTDNILQIKTGSFEGTSGSATLDVAPTAGNAIFIAVGIAGDGVASIGVTKPTGFEKSYSENITGTAKHGVKMMFMKPSATGSESSWTLSVVGGSQQVVWAALEVDAVVDFVDFAGAELNEGVFIDNGAQPIGDSTVVASRASSTSETSQSYDAMAFAVFLATSVDTTVPVISGYNGNWQEMASVSRSNATRAVAMTVVFLPMIDTQTFQCTASVSPSSYFFVGSGAVTALAARHAFTLYASSGFEVGTATGLARQTQTGYTSVFDAVAGSPAVVTTTARTGSYCLELSSSAAAENVQWLTLTLPLRGTLDKGTGGGQKIWIERMHIRFPTSLPSGDVELWAAEVGSIANGVILWYRSASQKLGVKIGTGTEVLSDAVVAADKWIGVDIYYDPRTTTHVLDWQVDYDADDLTLSVVQTRASTTSMTAGVITKIQHGWHSSRTATVRYDDIVCTLDRKAYPIGNVHIRPLKVDPAGTPSVSGNTANFKVFTNNGTMNTWNAANARAAIDDIPPVTGSTSDGVAQVTAASSEYMEFPMETYLAAPNHVLRAVRFYCAGWADSGNPAFMSIWAWDGTTAYPIIGGDDHALDNTTVDWIVGQLSYDFIKLTQTMLDNMAIRVGFATDATPDVGIHAVLCELITQPATVYGIMEIEGGAFNMYVRQDPLSGAAASYLVTTPPGSRGATAEWVISGVGSSQYVGPNTTYEKNVSADSVYTVESVTLTPDPA